MVRFLGIYATPFLPRTSKRLLMDVLPPELADIIVAMADDEPHRPWDPYGHWAAFAEPEYDREGHYGSLSMAQVQVVDWV